MRKRRRFLGNLLLVISILVAGLAAISLAPLSPLKPLVEVKLSDTLGRKVTINSVRFSLTSGPHLILSGMTAQEDSSFGDGIFLKANEVWVKFDVIRYLRSRQIVIQSIILKSPQIELVRKRDGDWNWTTLGKRASERPALSSLTSVVAPGAAILSLLADGSLSAASLREIKIESAIVKLRDYSGSQPSEVLYKNIAFNASLTAQDGEDSRGIKLATGNLDIHSPDDGENDPVKATLPFALKIDGRNATSLSVSGSIGPGPIETKNLSIGAFAINGEINAVNNSPLTGDGRMSINDLDIHTINLSERVARALKLDQIGDMNPGTGVTSLETDFAISQGAFQTTGLRIEQLDGLGDATAQNGSFRIESALMVNYAATIVLSPDATSRLKSMNSAVGILVTILETNNRVSVPVNVIGDVRNPEVQVDVSRIF